MPSAGVAICFRRQGANPGKPRSSANFSELARGTGPASESDGSSNQKENGMRLHTTLMTAALLGIAALPVAAQSPQRLNEEHAEWHRKHDRDAYRNPRKYQEEHAEEHARLNQQYQRYGYNNQRYGYGYPQQYPQNGNGWYDSNGRWHQNPTTSGGWYDQNGNWHPANQGGSLWDRILGRSGQQQNGYYDQNGNWHPYNQQQGGYYDQYGNWHPYSNNGDYRRDDDDRGRGRNPKAEGHHDNGKHNGWNKHGREDDDRD